MKIFFLIFFLVSTIIAKPEWISNPTQDGKIKATVVVINGNYPKHIKERVAIMQAKANLSHLENIHIEDSINIKYETSDKKTKSKVSTKTSLSSDNTMKVKIKDSYQDSNGTSYLWVVVE